MNTVLVALDFSPATRSVLREARRFALMAKCRLVLTNVVRIPFTVPEYPGMIPDMTDAIDACVRASDVRLSRLCGSLSKAGIRAEKRICIGNPANEIVRAARAVRASHIILGSHGHGVIRSLVVGSTAAPILRHAPCPVVVIGQAIPRDSKGKARP